MVTSYITKYKPLFEPDTPERYKLSDHFCWFWLHYLKDGHVQMDDFWQVNQHRPSQNVWRGLAFEEVCFNHVAQIKKGLGISGVAAKVGTYSIRGDKDADGLQLDMVIDRDDNVLNLCEMKFVKGEFEVSESYYRKVNNRVATIASMTAKNIHSTLVTTDSLKYNSYSGAFLKTLTLDDLFAG